MWRHPLVVHVGYVVVDIGAMMQVELESLYCYVLVIHDQVL